MDKHNSQVNLVGEVGVGTTFWFDLPVYDMTEYKAPELVPSELPIKETATVATSETKTEVEAASSGVA